MAQSDSVSGRVDFHFLKLSEVLVLVKGTSEVLQSLNEMNMKLSMDQNNLY